MNDMNEQSGNSGQLPPDALRPSLLEGGAEAVALAKEDGLMPPDAGSDGDALASRAAYALATSWRRQAASQKSGRNTLIRCAEELEAAIAARQPVGAEPTGWLCTWRSDGRTELREHPIYMEHPYNAGRWQCQPLYTAPPMGTP